jgi:hypothetical protein
MATDQKASLANPISAAVLRKANEGCMAQRPGLDLRRIGFGLGTKVSQQPILLGDRFVV